MRHPQVAAQGSDLMLSALDNDLEGHDIRLFWMYVGYVVARSAPVDLGRMRGCILGLIEAHSDTEGVRKIGERHDGLKLNGPFADVKLGIREFFVLRTVTIIDDDTRGSLSVLALSRYPRDHRQIQRR